MSSPSCSISKKAISVALLACLLAAPPVLAGIYKWTDEEGNVHFTDSPDKIPLKFRGTDRGTEKIKERAVSSATASDIPELPQVVDPERKHEVHLLGGVNGHLVRVRLNDKVDALLIVDTGASYLTLSDKIGAKLGIEMREDGPQLPLKTAAGMIWSPLITLDSLQVGTARIRNIEANINDKLDGIDGLLGMTFLGEYEMSINQKRNTLVLKPLMHPGDPAWGGRSGDWWKQKFTYFSTVVAQMESLAKHTADIPRDKMRNIDATVELYNKRYQILKDHAAKFGVPDEYRVSAR